GWYARRMGVPIKRFIIGSNRNDIVARWLDTGALVTDEVVPTLSPAMDIQVSSNMERLIFELAGREGDLTAELMVRFRELGAVEVPREPSMVAARVDDDATIGCIRDVYESYGYLVDPHTAVGIAAARLRREQVEGPIICLATA